jgi:hypothetical protein
MPRYRAADRDALCALETQRASALFFLGMVTHASAERRSLRRQIAKAALFRGAEGNAALPRDA